MTAIDELRKLLDERGVEWKEGSPNKTKWVHDGIEFVAVNAWPRNGGAKTRLILHANLTPEQAIAATLGGGMLTADDVRDAIERYSDASGGNGRDLHSWAYTAIADELNATLGAGTCEVESMHSYTDAFARTSWCVELSCHTLGAWEDPEPPNYCPWCGRKVRGDA